MNTVCFRCLFLIPVCAPDLASMFVFVTRVCGLALAATGRIVALQCKFMMRFVAYIHVHTSSRETGKGGVGEWCGVALPGVYSTSVGTCLHF